MLPFPLHLGTPSQEICSKTQESTKKIQYDT